jgi:hypothetical protein
MLLVVNSNAMDQRLETLSQRIISLLRGPHSGAQPQGAQKYAIGLFKGEQTIRQASSTQSLP